MTATRLAIGIGGINIEVEGEEEFAREVFDFFKEKLAERVSATPLTPAPAAKEEPVAAAEGVGSPSLRDFHTEKKPQSDMERVTVFAYYKSQFEGIPEVRESDLVSMYDEVRERRPQRIRNALSNARQQKDWFDRGSAAGLYRISGLGKNLVEHDLPR